MRDEAVIIREGVTAAIRQTLEPAAMERAYPGHFTIVADGHWFGQENTWPGLDSWQMAGAYLLLGRTRLVLDYFDYVQASQRDDGNIPYAIVSADIPPDHLATYNRGMNYPADVFTFDPKREGYGARKWIGSFSHWIAGINPLGTLAAVSYVLLGDEIFTATGDRSWLESKLPSLERAAAFLLSRKSGNGLIAGAGFYTEMPPRHQWDGVAQCYVVHILNKCAGLNEALGLAPAAARWRAEAETLAAR
ncbi:MAG: hypothetical protein JWM88_2035, partial [Verrucomicrobia bacterium]|nr:hypothetical protein [Verrucomicrobiota bacterium]